MSQPNWEEVNVPRGAFIGWGSQIGQHVTGRVLEYNPTGGTNFAGDVCPQLSVELTEPAASFTKDGARTDFAAAELVVLNCGQVSLKRAVKAADPSPGDLVKIELSSLVKTANGTVKEFSIRIARTGQAKPQPQQFQAAPAAVAPFQQAPAQALPPF
jgi:hypothetical protein